VGCSGALRKGDEQHLCCFATLGFEQDGKTFAACGTAYHLGCVVVGEPFRSRLPNGKGLSFPKVAICPNFVCELCTVRAVVGRELTASPKDTSLLMLERMRMIDQASAWDPKTLASYQAHLRRIQRFEMAFGVKGLVPTLLDRPPVSPAISIMWAQQQYTLETPRKTHVLTADRITYASARALRSAASQFYTWDMQIAHPRLAVRDAQRRGHLTLGCLPTDELGYTLMTTGMARRMGDESRPCVALTFAQVMKISRYLDQSWIGPLSLDRRRDVAAAAVTHIGFWMTWLRSTEFFSLEWSDVVITRPEHHSRKGLPEGVGVVEMTLLEETKTNRTSVADIVVAYTALASGLSLGMWLERLQALWPDHVNGDVPLIRGSDGKRWTSTSFRHDYVYPWLHMLKQEGDPTLLAFTQEEGNRIPDKYYSMNMYRRGANSHVTKRRGGKKRRATEVEVYEHGRWRQKRQSEDMPTRYREFTLEDRVYITLLCM